MMKLVRDHDVVVTRKRHVWISEWEIDGKRQLIVETHDLADDPREDTDSFLSFTEARKVAKALLKITAAA